MLQKLSVVVEKLEDWHGPFPKLEMVDFAMKIDQILKHMSSVEKYLPQHAGFKAMKQIAGVCKYMGYKANEQPNPNLVPVLSAFWADSIEFVQNLVDAIDNPEESAIVVKQVGDVLVKRLQWVVKKMNPNMTDVTIKDLNFDDLEKVS